MDNILKVIFFYITNLYLGWRNGINLSWKIIMKLIQRERNNTQWKFDTSFTQNLCLGEEILGRKLHL